MSSVYSLSRLTTRGLQRGLQRGLYLNCRYFCSSKSETDDPYLEDEFERMPFVPPQYLKTQEKSGDKSFKSLQPTLSSRYQRMSTDQDWNSVWPAARNFNPHTVPFPIYQGLLRTATRVFARPNKFANHELLKIPNFLHLSPTNITKQCQALKKFCNPWPKGLETDEQIEKHFPLEIITYDYCHSSPSIRDPRARVVVIKLKLSSLELDYHAKDKMIRLLSDRYDPKTDVLAIKTESCPLKQQNIDYALYQLTACYFESWKTEDWESLKTEDDWETFYWPKSDYQTKMTNYLKQIKPNLKDEDLENSQELKEYSQALAELRECENDESLEKYQKNVLQLMFN